MNGYPSYSYYGQPMYPQQPQIHPSQLMQQPPNGYPSFYPPHPSQQVPPAPIPIPYDPEAYAANNSGSSSSKKKSRRVSAPSGSAAAPQPLKSALKKTPAAITATPMVNSMEFPQPSHGGYVEYPITRQRTNSIGHLNGTEARRRANSNPYSNHGHGGIDPPFQPIHLFISFLGSNEIKLENVTEFALKELSEKIWPLWPDGVETLPTSASECLIKFRNQPWDMSGPNYLTAIRLLQELFTLCCRRGYVFQTAINTGAQQVPRLIFQVQTPDEHSQFFLAYFSSSGRRMTIINAPSHVDLSLAVQLKAALPRKVTTELTSVNQENIRTIEIKRGINSSVEVAPALFLAHILKILTSQGFDLDFSIPLQKRSLLRSSQEVLVFKGVSHPAG